MPHRRNSFSQNPININQPTTPRRSPRLLHHNHTTPFNSKPIDSTRKPSNQKKSIQSRGIPLRKSPRLSNREQRVSVTKEINEEPIKCDKSSNGSRRPAKSKVRDGIGTPEEAKVEEKEDPAGNRGVASEEFSVKGKKRNGKGNEGGEKEKEKEKGKRKRKRSGKDISEEGWTKEQELALQRAYISAKPSPHFWKNVSKLVPGKSQQDCFDRIHRDHITPPQLHSRSRAKTIKSSPIQKFSISASKLLKPMNKKVRRSNILKLKDCIAQKSVEKLLQRRLQVDQDCKGDIFSVLEPNIDFSTNIIQPSVALSTPKQQRENQGLLQSCTETSSSSHKSLSRFTGSCITNLVSPPVLKQVKNKGLHEKYINQLRCRDARRRANSSRIRNPITGKIVEEGCSIRERDAVKAAKVALASEARDAINKFQQLQVNFMDNTSCSDEDNDDIELIDFS